jgi:hypothetical protein
VDLTHWFCWITVAGAVMGLLAAVQQLLIHGLRPLVRAVLVTAGLGSVLALAYPYLEVRTTGAGIPKALAVNTTPGESAPTGPGAQTPTAVNPTAITAGPLPVESKLVESMPLGPAPLEPATANSAVRPTEPAPTGPMQVELEPVNSVPIKSVPINRSPVAPGIVQVERAETAGFKPTLPALLSAEQRLFSPSEVAYCPTCFSAYSSNGPTVGVKCVHCAAQVNLVSSRDYMVHRCSKCGKLCRTTHFPPAIGPYVFRYYCPFCKEYHWFVN